MASKIIELSELISSSVASLVDVCSKNGLEIPNLDESFSLDSEDFRTNADVARSAKIIAAAAFQLVACVLPPHESVMHVVSGHMKSAALRVSIECHVAEILREAGSEGLHTNEIAARTNVDGVKLGRMLRLLANRHIFREIRPDYFVNNRISGTLDTGKSIDEILRDQTRKHDGTSGFPAFAELYLTAAHKGSAYLMENMKDPMTAFSEEPNHAPFQRGINSELSYYEWYLQPEQVYERRYFGAAMGGLTDAASPDFIAESFDWSSLANDAIVVDVGGGIGSAEKIILKSNPHLRFTVQDLPLVIEDGIKHWEREDPDALASGQITFKAHSFFSPQPITDASVFLVKNVSHNWSDINILKILTNLRNSAKPDTVLVILDAIMTYSCREPSAATNDFVVEDVRLAAPELLATGFNSVDTLAWTIDAALLLIVNTKERTLEQFKQLLTKCGWRITKVIRRGSFLDSVQAIPV